MYSQSSTIFAKTCAPCENRFRVSLGGQIEQRPSFIPHCCSIVCFSTRPKRVRFERRTPRDSRWHKSELYVARFSLTITRVSALESNTPNFTEFDSVPRRQTPCVAHRRPSLQPPTEASITNAGVNPCVKPVTLDASRFASLCTSMASASSRDLLGNGAADAIWCEPGLTDRLVLCPFLPFVVISTKLWCNFLKKPLIKASASSVRFHSQNKNSGVEDTRPERESNPRPPASQHDAHHNLFLESCPLEQITQSLVISISFLQRFHAQISTDVLTFLHLSSSSFLLSSCRIPPGVLDLLSVFLEGLVLLLLAPLLEDLLRTLQFVTFRLTTRGGAIFTLTFATFLRLSPVSLLETCKVQRMKQQRIR